MCYVEIHTEEPPVMLRYRDSNFPPTDFPSSIVISLCSCLGMSFRRWAVSAGQTGFENTGLDNPGTLHFVLKYRAFMGMTTVIALPKTGTPRPTPHIW